MIRLRRVTGERASVARGAHVRALVDAIKDGDPTGIEEAVLRLSRSRRVFAPLVFAIGAFVMLFDGLRLLLFNWRLMLVQVLPALWIWLAMYDLRAHLLDGASLQVLRGPVLIPVGVVIVAITALCFFLNAVFAFAIAGPGVPEIRPAIWQGRQRLAPILASGTAVGVLLAVSTTVLTRAGRLGFALSLGVVVGLMMVCYVAVPARLIGVTPRQRTRDKVLITALVGILGAIVCAPPYALGRVGILMLGAHALLIPGIVLFALGVMLQAGATGAVRAIKLSSRLIAAPESKRGHAS